MSKPWVARLSSQPPIRFCSDSGGTWVLLSDSPPSASGAYKLTGITDVAEELKIEALFDRDWPDYTFPLPSKDPMLRGFICCRSGPAPSGRRP